MKANNEGKVSYRIYGSIGASILICLFMTSAQAFGPSWTDNPPNLQEGIGIFNGPPTQADCRNCHYDPERFPQLSVYNPTRHHLKIKRIIPESTIAPNGVPGEKYNCLTCHQLDRLPSGRLWFKDFRDCLGCHTVEQVTGKPETNRNVHHFTKTYEDRKCHDCHVPPEGLQSKACVICHDGGYTKENIKGAVEKPYAHRVLADNPRVACMDCHNPSKVPIGESSGRSPGIGSGNTTNLASDVLTGVWGVQPDPWPDNFQTPMVFKEVPEITHQYQLCLKCHSYYAFGDTPPMDPFGYSNYRWSSTSGSSGDKDSWGTLQGWDGRLTDQAKEFNPNNRSYHPVVAPGKNDFKNDRTGRSYASALINGMTPESVIGCADCHSPQNFPSSAGPKGPHGSDIWPIAIGKFDHTTGVGSGDKDSSRGGESRSSTFNNHMCFKCHDKNVYGGGSDSSKDDGHRTGYSKGGDKNLHYYHVEGKEAQCTTCHSAIPHGWKNKALLIHGTGRNPSPAPYNNHGGFQYKDDKTHHYGINSATPINSIPSGGWRKEVCHDAGEGTGDCK